MRYRIATASLALALGVTGLAAAPALAAKGATPASCDIAKARVAKFESAIAKLQARVDSGNAKHKEIAQKVVDLMKQIDVELQARLAAKGC